MGRDIIVKVNKKAAEGQQIFAAIEECVNNIQENIVAFGRLVHLLVEDAELRKAAGWETEDEMFADPLIKQGFEYVISLDSEWQVYRLKRMLKVDAKMPEANLLETTEWTGITQTSKIRELEELAEDEGLDEQEKATKASNIIHRPKEHDTTVDARSVMYDPSNQTVIVDGIPAMRFTTTDQSVIIRTLSRLLHVSDTFGVSGNKIVSRGDQIKDVAEVIGDKEMLLWITKRLRARKILQ